MFKRKLGKLVDLLEVWVMRHTFLSRVAAILVSLFFAGFVMAYDFTSLARNIKITGSRNGWTDFKITMRIIRMALLTLLILAVNLIFIWLVSMGV